MLAHLKRTTWNKDPGSQKLFKDLKNLGVLRKNEVSNCFNISPRSHKCQRISKFDSQALSYRLDNSKVSFQLTFAKRQVISSGLDQKLDQDAAKPCSKFNNSDLVLCWKVGDDCEAGALAIKIHSFNRFEKKLKRD